MTSYRNEYGHRDITSAPIKLSEHIDREPNISGSSILDIGYIVAEKLDNEAYVRDLQNALKMALY